GGRRRWPAGPDRPHVLARRVAERVADGGRRGEGRRAGVLRAGSPAAAARRCRSRPRPAAGRSPAGPSCPTTRGGLVDGATVQVSGSRFGFANDHNTVYEIVLHALGHALVGCRRRSLERPGDPMYPKLNETTTIGGRELAGFGALYAWLRDGDASTGPTAPPSRSTACRRRGSRAPQPAPRPCRRSSRWSTPKRSASQSHRYSMPIVGLSCWQCSAPVSSSGISVSVTSTPWAFAYSYTCVACCTPSTSWPPCTIR